ncbi:hypothetical protein B5S28_g3666 [[Candida] boidinii]|nr:hypothetical protein B5S28_g3666 [[Candida] boidinii]OWB63295.1 hypothetical protein B5S29_g4264 [[Candida] boidinii]OWB74337.1 hypothetical protein B5S31_g4126 [[Candida] boidinii]OWB80416.1 hypothetical protein B5S32_g4691 [[Candida] boidinii]
MYNHPLYIQPFSPYDKKLPSLPSDKKTSKNEEKIPVSVPATKEDSVNDDTVTEESKDTVDSKNTDEKKPKILDDSSISFIEERHTNEILKYNFLSHMSLDIFESPYFEPNKIKDNCNLLFVQDGVYVFGFESNTGLKIILGTSRKESEILNSDLSIVFKEIHKSYLRLICNPFKSIDDTSTIENKNFDKRIFNIVENWNSKIDKI